MATLCCGRLGDTDQQGVLQVRERFSELERSYSKPKSKNTEFMMEVESVSACSFATCVCVCVCANLHLLHFARRRRVELSAVSCVPVCVLKLNACVHVCHSLPARWPASSTVAVLVVPLPSPQLCRELRAGRLTSCKSAKDRTGMAVTLEEASILSQHHRLDPDSLIAVLNALRR